LLSFVGGLKYFQSFLTGMPFSVITDSSALAWLKTSKDQPPCFQRWWGYISSFVFTIQHRPGARIVTEDALSRRPDMEDTALEDDMLSLPDPDDFSLPGPSGLAPPSTLTAALILPSHIKPPITDNGVLIQYDVPDTPEYSAGADIACAPPRRCGPARRLSQYRWKGRGTGKMSG
jgi:hypothetical protein